LTTDYILEVTDFNGCINSDTLNIEVINDFKLFVNNVVTPNGNGENDTWYVENIESLSTARVYIYNRRGTEIYYDDNYKNDWNGYLNDDELPDGTYYYIINFTNSEKVYRGSITLLRNK
jgi:gliding motility-associated-like protein